MGHYGLKFMGFSFKLLLGPNILKFEINHGPGFFWIYMRISPRIMESVWMMAHERRKLVMAQGGYFPPKVSFYPHFRSFSSYTVRK